MPKPNKKLTVGLGLPAQTLRVPQAGSNFTTASPCSAVCA